ncbi:POU class 2 homeobox associating factor 3 [Melozone crissalis]|uniref:POU class 2 homeobox associating factor 3 n=1 Tax=Melozone crissalis TaxID=40204 RepID=UPI0023D9EC76|nr:POU class 2 homeobox associating factor 3 [Melozone crissalis]
MPPAKAGGSGEGGEEGGRRHGTIGCCPPGASAGVFPQILPGKPKVYQGVRVKITVKELLQQRRARQAATGSAEKVKSGGEGSHLGDLHKAPWDSSSSSSIQFAEPVSPPHPEPFEAEPIPPVPSCCPPWQFSSCLSCEESPGYLEQLIDSCLQSDAPSEPAFSAFQPSPHYTPDTSQPVQLCFNQGLSDCLELLPPLAVAEDFFRRDRSWDICYS